MQKAMQRILLRLGAVGCFTFLMFNFPLLSIYNGEWFGFPALFIAIFGIWFVAIVLALLILEDRRKPIGPTREGSEVSR